MDSYAFSGLQYFSNSRCFNWPVRICAKSWASSAGKVLVGVFGVDADLELDAELAGMSTWHSASFIVGVSCAILADAMLEDSVKGLVIVLI
jgi:hypothetical protein